MTWPSSGIVLAFVLSALNVVAAIPPPAANGQLTVTGQVLMPDGSPAGGAIVASLERNGLAPNITKAGVDGSFQLTGHFLFDCRLHARSGDETHQATLIVPSVMARTGLAKSVVLKLAPAREYAVSVRAADKPVEAAQVLISSATYKILRSTNADGIAKIWIPSDEKLRSLAAWHPELGVAGKHNNLVGLPGATTQLTLVPPKAHTVRVIADNGQPVPGLKLGVSVGVSGTSSAIDWIMTDQIEMAQGFTDEHGELKLSWIPGENLKYLNPEVIDTAWKVDEIERDKVSEGFTTLRVRRMVAVIGQLKLPDGANAEGILVCGFGFGSGSNGAALRARARADGSFSFAATSNHGYALRIADSEWASGDWSGMILATNEDKPVAIVLNAYTATPLEVNVTRGPQHEPVPNASVLVSCERQFYWTDSQGEKQGALPSMSYWLLTDANGMARTGLGKGKHKVNLSVRSWNEERVVEIQEEEKRTVSFYRPWLKSRMITGRLFMNDAPQNAFPTTEIRAEAPENGPVAILPEIRPDGSFKLEADASDVAVFVLDNVERLSGFGKVLATANTLDLTISRTADFSGTVVDEKDKPLQDAFLQMVVGGTRFAGAKAQMTDKQGNFRFGAVAANVPVQLQIRRKGDGDKVQFSRTRFFLPGEVREKTRIVVRSTDPDDQDLDVVGTAVPESSLADRVDNVTRDARLNGMRALIVLQGDETEEVKKLTAAILDTEDLSEVLGFLPAVVDAKNLKTETAKIKEYGWQSPKPGEVVLIALDRENTLGFEQVATGKLPTAIKLATAFVKKHAPIPRDAMAMLMAAQKEAESTGRRVWVIEGGPRCGPCIKLARWIEEHHALLGKDYVIVKTLQGYDESVGEVVKLLDQPAGAGIPWMAIIEPGGVVLTTSDGPLGNFGFPSTIEDKRHLREMLRRTARKLTAREQDRLADSLTRSEL